MTPTRPALSVTGLELRYLVCLLLLDAPGPMTVSEVLGALHERGVVPPGRPSKTLSDALRWEVRRGRVRRLARGLYGAGTMPRSTEWWIRRRVAAARLSLVAPTLAAAHHG